MSKEQAKTWITTQFIEFYLNEEIALIADSLTEQNFVSSVSDFVTANKAIAETEIRANHTQAEADVIIARLESLNYELMKMNYFNIYNQVDPNELPLDPVGIEYMEWLQADINTLKRYAPDIFAGGLDANENSTKAKIQAALKAVSELQDDITTLKTSLESINTKA
jgi:hypothetical protein